MCEWRSISLGDFCQLKRGYDLPTRERRPGPFPLVSSSGPSNWHDEAKVKGPGVVTGRYGTISEVFYVADDFWPLNTALYIRDFKGNDPRFVYYFLKTLDWNKFNDKSGVPGVNRNDAHKEPVFVPHLKEQQAIAGVLGALDDKIELNRQMCATLEAMARDGYRAVQSAAAADAVPVSRQLLPVGPPMNPKTGAPTTSAFANFLAQCRSGCWKIRKVSKR